MGHGGGPARELARGQDPATPNPKQGTHEVENDMAMLRLKTLLLASLPAFYLLTSGCTPVISKRGYLPDPVAEASIIVGKDTKETIEKKLGDPTTRSNFNGRSWYYISSVQQQVAFFPPTILSRDILAIHFKKNGTVTGLRHYGLRDSHVVAFDASKTPTPGREVTFLQQLLNATPGVPLGQGSGGGIDQRNPGGGH